MAKKKDASGKKNNVRKKSRVEGTIKRSLSKKSLEKEIEFIFYAPLASSVGVGGTFNNWNPSRSPLKRHVDGTWKGNLLLKPGKYEYRYLIDGRWENEQKECEQVYSGLGSYNCVLKVD